MRITKLLPCLLLLSLLAAAKQPDGIADSVKLKSYVYTIAANTHRNIDDTAALNRTAIFIMHELAAIKGTQVPLMSYNVNGKEYSNILASFGPENAPRIIIGAHYDVCGQQAGADDNASGVAGLLELARLLQQAPTDKWKYRIDLVAYTLEEPPTFRTQAMGSAVHAKYMADEHMKVAGMISLEMIGYYRDARHTQRYPLGIFKLFYGTRGNYITVVKKLHNGPFTRRFTRRFKRGDNIITKAFSGPRSIPGVDFSDHLNYWAHGWDALMITDTSFLRNANYHEPTDTPDTLDYARMSFVVTNLFRALSSMAG